jgi:hypothetical protein
MDSEAAAFGRIISRDIGKDKEFSDWVNIAERFLYVKPYESGHPNEACQKDEPDLVDRED